MHSRDGHVPDEQWEVMGSNEAATRPPVSIQLLRRRNVTYNGLCNMLEMLDNSATPAKSRQRRLLKFRVNGLSWTRRALKGTGQTPAGPQPMGYNLLPVCNNLPGA